MESQNLNDLPEEMYEQEQIDESFTDVTHVEEHNNEEIIVETHPEQQLTSQTQSQSAILQSQVSQEELLRQRRKRHLEPRKFLASIQKKLQIVTVEEMFKLQQLRNETNTVEEKINTMNEKLNIVNHTNESAVKQLEIEKDFLKEAEKNLQEIGNATENLKAFVSNTEKTLEGLQVKASDLTKKFKNLETRAVKEKKNHQDKVALLVSTLNTIENSLAELKTEPEIRYQEVNYKLEEMRGKVFEATRKLQETDDAIEAILKKNNLSKNETDLNISELLKNDLTNKKDFLKHLLEVKGQMQRETQQNFDTLAVEKELKLKELETTKVNLSEMSDQLNLMNEEVRVNATTLNSLITENSELQELGNNLKLKLDTSTKNFVTLNADYIKVKEEKTNELQNLNEKLKCLKNDNKILNDELKLQKQQYYESVEQKGKLLSLKADLKIDDAKLSFDANQKEAELEKLYKTKQEKEEYANTLTEKLVTIQLQMSEHQNDVDRKLDTLKEESAKLKESHGTTIEDIKKNKEYLQASIDYLKDKLQKKKELIDTKKSFVQTLREDNIKVDTEIEMKKRKLLSLTTYENKLNNQLNPEVLGILKRPTRSPGPSSKMVKFEGVPSSQDSESVHGGQTLGAWLKDIKEKENLTTPIKVKIEDSI